MKKELEEIKHIRSLNNILWMEILDIALACDPKKTKALLRGIRHSDILISDQIASILDEDSQADNLP